MTSSSSDHNINYLLDIVHGPKVVLSPQVTYGQLQEVVFDHWWIFDHTHSMTHSYIKGFMSHRRFFPMGASCTTGGF